ncbi:MAG TPA: chemotaxis protein CheW [Candidatus Limnocylindrales bacterium]|nr:chemotaxis protein CheW [Candidatus Limnocylindrales bacterium]
MIGRPSLLSTAHLSQMSDEVVRDNLDEEEIEVETDQYLVFTVKNQEFGFQAMRVQEISSVINTTEIPNAPPYIEGIMNLRGRLASVISFRKKFGFEPKEYDEDTRIIILEQGGFPIGIVVDSVEEVIKIPDEKVQKLPQTSITPISEEYIIGVGILDKRLIILLDVDKVLSKTEIAEVSTVSQRAMGGKQ